jgi:DNA-binding MarR family transcriptional regulator
MEPRTPLSLLIMQAYLYTRRSFDEALRKHGVSAAQLGVLNRIAARPGLSGAELAREMFTTPQAAQLMLATLERKGLVERAADPNHGRIIRSTLTDAGQKVVDVCRADAWAHERRLGAALDEHEREELVELLVRYVRPGDT